MPYPLSTHDPVRDAMPRQAVERAWTPPMWRADSSSAISSAKPSRSASCGTRRVSRSVSKMGNSGMKKAPVLAGRSFDRAPARASVMASGDLDERAVDGLAGFHQALHRLHGLGEHR